MLAALMMLQLPAAPEAPDEGAPATAPEPASQPASYDTSGPLADSQGGTRQDYVDVNDPLGTYYPGDEGITFTLWVDEDYDAPVSVTGFWTMSLWADEPWPSTNEDAVYDVSVDIEGVVDEKGTAANVVQWVYDDAWNDGPDDDHPINFSGARTWYADDGDDNQVPFEFNINPQVTPGTYFLQVEIDYKVCTAYNSGELPTKSNPRFNGETYNEQIEFVIRSGVEPSPYDLSIPTTAYSDAGAQMPLYAGAQFQEVRIPVTAGVGDIQNVVGAPADPSGAAISLDSRTKTSEISTLPAGWGGSFKFRVNVGDNQAPAVVESSITITYVRIIGGQSVEIREVLQTQWVVDFTPLLTPQDPDSGDEYLTVSVDDMMQGEDYNSGLTIGFTNTGNVALENLEVTLDLTNARYLYTSTFYYDEGGMATKVSFPPLTQTIQSLGVGYSANIPFAFDVRPNIPPGKYIVPIEYEGWYFDDGTTGAATGFVNTDVAMHYNTIMGVRDAFWDEPFIYLYVTDDHVDVNARVTNANVTAKDEGVLIDVEITNEEAYTLTDVTAYVECGDGTPFDNPRGEEFTELEGFRIGNLAGGATVTATFKADVRAGLSEAEYRDVVVLLEGEDELGLNYTLAAGNPMRTKGYVEVFPVPPYVPPPPMLIVQDVHSADVVLDASEQYALTITVRNVGGQNASNVQVLLTDNHDLLHPTQSIQTVPNVITTDGTGAESTVTYQILVDPNVELGQYYEATVLFMYEDEFGNTHEFGDGAGTDVTVRIKEEPEPEPEEEPFLTLPLATLLLGILVLVSFLIGGILVAKGMRNMGTGGPVKRRVKDLDDDMADLAPAPAPAPMPGPHPAPGPGRPVLTPGPQPAPLTRGPAPGGPMPGEPISGGPVDYEPPPPDDF